MKTSFMTRAAAAVLALNLLLLAAVVLAGCNEAETAITNPGDGGEQAVQVGRPEPAATDPSKPYITFAINVHDTEHIDESADTVLRLVGLFEKYGVKGDFYLTAPVVQGYVERRPEVIERLRTSNMTISYHVRPPDPLYAGFDQSLRGLDEAALQQDLLDYETYGLDMASGGLDRSRPGGYTFVAQTLGRNPVAAPSPSSSQRIKEISQKVYAGLGARMTLSYHEEGSDPGQPFVWVEGMLVRPSDIGVTRWGIPGPKGKGQFWWSMLDTPQAANYNPTGYLQQQLAAWQARKDSGEVSRQPFVTALIHENNFARSGAEGWTLSYYADTAKDQPLSPPYDLNAPDPSIPRTPEEQAGIWAAYEEMVAWSTANLNVVTSEDIVALAAGQSGNTANSQ